MDPLSQGALGAVLPQVAHPRERLGVLALVGALAGMAPDLDVFIASDADPLLFLEYHRQFTHALVFIPIGAGIVALALYGFVRRSLRPVETYLACLLGYATHGLLDACTSYGTQLLWPFTDYRVAWNNVSVVDPLFTLPLLALVVAAAIRARRALAWAGLAWALGYLALGVVQNQRAEAAGRALAAARGHEAARLTAKAGFGNLLVWKVVYEHAGRYYVDGVRAGLATTFCGGESVAAYDQARDLPWLDLGTQQARDIERFRWFSEDYIALQPGRPNRVMDVRYAVLPHRIAPLWGVEVSPAAAARDHADFIADRRFDRAQREAYWTLLTGAACERARG